jgi:hypothetical protein
VGESVLKKNLKISDRKGGKAEDRWIGPYIVLSITERGLYMLEKDGRELKQAVCGDNLKKYID